LTAVALKHAGFETVQYGGKYETQLGSVYDCINDASEILPISLLICPDFYIVRKTI